MLDRFQIDKVLFPLCFVALVKSCKHIVASLWCCEMSRVCTCSGNANCGFSSVVGGWKWLGVTPNYLCGEVAVMRTTRTTRNAEMKFWGCPNFKVSSMSVVVDFFFKLLNVIIVHWFLSSFDIDEESIGCNYFKWCGEDDIDERDGVIFKQKRKICTLEKSNKLYEKWVKYLIRVVCVVVVLNIILV